MMQNICRNYFSKIAHSLKILNLQKPTTHSLIKSKYLQLVKQHHPDTNKLSPATTFIQISEAYRVLKSTSQKEINQTEQKYSQSSNQDEAPPSPMKPQQKARSQAYEYLNRKVRRSTQSPLAKQPFYRQVPEFCLGILVAFLSLCEWGYLALTRTEKHMQQKQQSFSEGTFKGLKNRKRFDEKCLQF